MSSPTRPHKADDAEPHMTKLDFVPVIICGAGISGICMGVQLKRQLGFTDIQLYEKDEDFGGTWLANTYPGCACDVPSAFYSFSFATNPKWTKFMPPQPEIRAYYTSVAEEYGLREQTSFKTVVEESRWIAGESVDAGGRWHVTLKDLQTGRRFQQECLVLISAIGGLSIPQPPEATADFSKFKGAFFHSARWDHSVSLEDKNVVVIGNGCSASQLIPIITPRTRSLTQIARTPHWVLPSIDFKYPAFVTWMFKHIPLFLLLHRFTIFLAAESTFRHFYLDAKAKRLRDARQEDARDYMLKTAPAKYHHLIIPKFDIGCKRRIFDTSYMKILNSDKLHLTMSPLIEVGEHSVRTKDGDYPADVIVLATGFVTGTTSTRILGRSGKELREVWKEQGGAGAYDSTAVHGFPNFFILMGPNSATGHTSVVMAVENVVNLSIKLLKPILRGQASDVEIKEQAEQEYTRHIQADLRNRIWVGCQSWYHTEHWNPTVYPWSQVYFWWRCLNPNFSDWEYHGRNTSRSNTLGMIALASVMGGLALYGRRYVAY